ncbi:MAG: hypothetical protein ACXVJ7_14480 [Acidimicrobiia bacterium]
MRAVLLWSRVDARRRAGTLLGLALLIAIAGGATLATFAGARRSATALDRLRERTRSLDAAVFGDPGQIRSAISDRRVGAAGEFTIAAVAVTTHPDLFPFVEPLDDGIGRTIERPLILSGRRADERCRDEVVLPEGVARRITAEAR